MTQEEYEREKQKLLAIVEVIAEEVIAEEERQAERRGEPLRTIRDEGAEILRRIRIRQKN